MYQRLAISVENWPNVDALVKETLEPFYFADVHVMLRLPLRQQGINAGCNFAIAHVLFAAVGSISMTLFSPRKSGGYTHAFKEVLIEYYPWDEEPDVLADKRKTYAGMLYDEFRGPITHHLAILKEARIPLGKHYGLEFERLKEPSGNGLSEEAIEEIETSDRWPRTEFVSTIEARDDKKLLKLERFYWGIRQMVLRLTKDSVKMDAAEIFLGNLSKGKKGKVP